MRQFLIIPHIEVQNANALSSSLTIGFPAMTAWLGAVHALQRHLNQDGFELLKFSGVGVICHDFDFHIGGDKFTSYVSASKRSPTTKREYNSFKKSNSLPLIPEGQCDLTVTLFIEYNGLSRIAEKDNLISSMKNRMHQNMRIAGGDVIKIRDPEICNVSNEGESKKLLGKVMPGYAITERRDLMIEAMESGKDALDALLDYLAIEYTPHVEEDEGEPQKGKKKIVWTSGRKTSGWIVPIATGFQGITPLGNVRNQRDPNTPHRFAESIITLGEFILPTQAKSVDNILWHYRVDHEKAMYLCEQEKKN